MSKDAIRECKSTSNYPIIREPPRRSHHSAGRINSNFHSHYPGWVAPPALCTRGKSRNFIKEAYPENERAIIE